MDIYPSLDLLFTKGGSHGIGQVVLPAGETVQILGPNPSRMTTVIRPATIADCIICGSADDNTGFPLDADSSFALPSKDAVFLRSATGGTVHFIELDS